MARIVRMRMTKTGASSEAVERLRPSTGETPCSAQQTSERSDEGMAAAEAGRCAGAAREDAVTSSRRVTEMG